MQKVKDHFQKIVAAVFQEDKNPRVIPGSDLVMEFSWYLHNDQDRKHKKSKTIKIIISQEQIEDYENLPLSQQSQIDSKITSFITYKKSQLDPDHNNPCAAGPPIEVWHVEV